MMQRWLAVLVSVALAGANQAPPPAAPDRDLQTGIQQAQEGDFDAAILTLDGVVRRLSATGRSPRDLSRAYLFLAIAYLGLAQEQSAKAKFVEALKANRDLELSAKELPPEYLKFFEQVRKEALASGALTPPPAPSPSPRAPVAVASQPAEKKCGSKKGILIGGGVALVGAGIALAAGGGGGGGSSAPPATTPPTTTPTPTTEPPGTTTPGSTTTTTQPTTGTTNPPGTTTTTTTTTATTQPPPPTTTPTTTQPPSCPNPNPPDASGTVSGTIVVTCSVPGAACTVRELGLRIVGGPLLGQDTSGGRSSGFGWNTRNQANGPYTLQCYVNFQGGAAGTANSQVTVQNAATNFR